MGCPLWRSCPARLSGSDGRKPAAEGATVLRPVSTRCSRSLRLCTKNAPEPKFGAGSQQIGNLPSDLWPLLVIGQATHVGKGATEGFGRYTLR